MKLKELGGKRIRAAEVQSSLRNSAVSVAVTELISSIISKSWTVVGSSEDLVQFVHQAISPIWDRLLLISMQALHWGFMAVEVIWDVADLKVADKNFPSAIVPIDFKPLDPSRTTFLQDDDSGEIVGVRYRMRTLDGEKEVDLLDEKVFWYSHRESFANSPYGIPISFWTKPYEEMMNDIIQLLAVWIENVSMPPLVGYAPDEMVNIKGGPKMSGVQYMAELLENLRSEGIAVLPSAFDVNGQPLWRIESPYRVGDGGQQIIATFEELMSVIRNAITGSEGSGGGVGMGIGGTMASGPSNLLSSYIFSEFVSSVNRRFIRYLVEMNWGPEEWARVKSLERGVDINLVRDILRTMLQFSDTMRGEVHSLVDWFALMQAFGIPIKATSKELPVEINVEGTPESVAGSVLKSEGASELPHR